MIKQGKKESKDHQEIIKTEKGTSNDIIVDESKMA